MAARSARVSRDLGMNVPQYNLGIQLILIAIWIENLVHLSM